ncbi:hypothetical protein J6590_000302 [Homalodisca vitripennis]|nr:hypothetical protein J6590_000302 [Homalodisca vitripennis]
MLGLTDTKLLDIHGLAADCEARTAAAAVAVAQFLPSSGGRPLAAKSTGTHSESRSPGSGR